MRGKDLQLNIHYFIKMYEMLFIAGMIERSIVLKWLTERKEEQIKTLQHTGILCSRMKQLVTNRHHLQTAVKMRKYRDSRETRKLQLEWRILLKLLATNFLQR